ncbi:hypothetical protein [Orbus mooreae]|uniref:hypothetical protein n=1 Tax=Orbus mooreae TaxID=3074107 RepID=UPI00370D76E7
MKKVSTYLQLATLFIILFSFTGLAETKVIHLVVALCDNKYQQIAPVPALIGNGQDPRNNLYWGAAYGVKTYFAKQPEWQVVQTVKPVNSHILEQIIYKHRSKDIYIVAEAYDGQYISDAVDNFISYSAGQLPLTLNVNGSEIKFGGDANLVVYVGHDFLMEWSWSQFLPDDWRWQTLSKEQQQLQQSRYVAVFACQSQRYFSPPLSRLGITPLILTTQSMAPEAYSIYAMIDGWVNNQSKAQIRQKVATAYSKYQRLNKPALEMFVTEYAE